MKRYHGHRWLIAAFALSSLALPALAAGPSVSITAPARGTQVTGDRIPITLTINAFNLECADVGKPAKLGQGHIHAMIDGTTMMQMSNLYCERTFDISGVGLKKGTHRIAVTLASDDHMDITKPVSVAFDYEPAEVKPLPAPIVSKHPTVAIVSPKNGATVPRTFYLEVNVSGFDLSCDLEGRRDIAGYGHLHVFALEKGVTDVKPATLHGGGMPMKGEMKGHGMPEMPMMSMVGMLSMPCTKTVLVDLSSWKAGKTRLMVMLADNDHEPTKGVAPAAIDVTLQ